MSFSIHPCEALFKVDLHSFLQVVTAECSRLHLLDDTVEIDHVCYRVDSIQEYLRIVSALSPYGIPIADSMINGRPITTYLLNEPMIFKAWRIPCIEIPCPKPGRNYMTGWEHIEIVIGEKSMGCTSNKTFLESFVKKHTDIRFDLKAIDKEINADISIEIENGKYSCKFHCRPLYEVCEFEKNHGLIEPVPSDYFP